MRFSFFVMRRLAPFSTSGQIVPLALNRHGYTSYEKRYIRTKPYGSLDEGYSKAEEGAFACDWSEMRHRNLASLSCEQNRRLLPPPLRRGCLKETTFLENGELLAENLEAMTSGL